MSKHTPGPWTVHSRCESAVVGATGFVVAACGGYSTTTRPADELHDELCANARLIAAAPDLLEALKGLLHDDGGSIAHSAGHEKCVAARAAIAKATGEA